MTILAMGLGGCGATSSAGYAAKSARNATAGNALTLADVRARLRTAGLQSRVGGEVEQSFLAVPGVLLRLPEAELQVYTYPNETDRAADTTPLDPKKVAPPTMRVTWIMPPSLVTLENVAVIVLTRDEALRARIRNALIAH